jgi:hypothetical protein
MLTQRGAGGAGGAAAHHPLLFQQQHAAPPHAQPARRPAAPAPGAPLGGPATAGGQGREALPVLAAAERVLAALQQPYAASAASQGAEARVQALCGACTVAEALGPSAGSLSPHAVAFAGLQAARCAKRATGASGRQAGSVAAARAVWRWQALGMAGLLGTIPTAWPHSTLASTPPSAHCGTQSGPSPSMGRSCPRCWLSSRRRSWRLPPAPPRSPRARRC